MRPLTKNEITKRGCVYCLDLTKCKIEGVNGKQKTVRSCSHNICPYRELDQYDTYADYLKHHKHESVADIIEAVSNMHRELQSENL